MTHVVWAPLAPELLGGELGAFSQSLELGPGNFGMAYPRAQPTVRPGAHLLAAHQIGIFDETLCYQLRVLDEIRGVAHDTGNEHLPLGQLDVFPHPPLMFVTGVGCLNRIAYGLDLQNEVYNIPEGDVVLVGAVIAAPAHVEAHRLLRNIPQGVVEGLNT